MLLHIRWGKLRTKIILWFAVPAALFLISVAVVIFFSQAESSFRALTVLLLVLSLAVPAGVVAVGTSRIAGPIHQLTHAAQEVANGNYGLTVTAETGDEIDELIKQFNLMSRQLMYAYTKMEAMVADRTRELATLNAIAQVLSQSPELEQILRVALNEATVRLNMQAGAILLVENESLILKVQQGISEAVLTELEAMKQTTGQDFWQGIAGKTISQGKPITWDSAAFAASVPESLAELARQEKVQTFVSAPLIHQGRILGVITLTSNEKQSFSPQSLELLASIGGQIGISIDNARLYDQARQEIERRKMVEQELRQANAETAQRNRDLTLLNQVITATTSDMAPQDVLEVVCCELVKSFEAHQAAAALLDEDGKTLTVVAECKDPAGLTALGVVIPVQENPATLYVLKHKQPLAAPDVQNDVLFTSVRSLMKQRNVVSLLLLPVLKNGEVIGTIGVDWWAAHEFNQPEITLATQVSAVAARALERTKPKQTA